MVHFATTITFAATLIGFAVGKDHSSHNCCQETVDGWVPVNDWTRIVCADYYGSVATFDGVKCIQKPGNTISGDDFYNLCKQIVNPRYWPHSTVGAGYRGTCS